MKIKVTHEVELQPFGTPNFILTVMAPGSRQDGIKDAPKIPLAEAEATTLSALCDRFRADIFEKAGKKDPRLLASPSDEAPLMNDTQYECSECVWIGNESEADDDSQKWLVCPACGSNIIETQRNQRMDTTAWLIETADPVGTTLYFCNDGDWCSNPNHGHKFPTADQASMKLAAMQLPQNFRVAEHMWTD